MENRIEIPELEEIWEKSDWYCPRCGEQKVWEDQGDVDHYYGSQYACTGCGGHFYLPDGVDVDNEFIKERLKQLRKGGE